MKVFIIAGEASGDQLGAAVLKSLYQQDGNLNIRGIGGEAMKSAGLRESLFPMEDLSLMGIFEVVPKIPHILKRIRQTVEAIRVFNPDVVLTIDSPDFCFRVQKELSKTTCRAKRIHMVAPTVWAWRPGRAKKIARFLDGLICLYPFEPPYFETEGLRSVFIGHTMMSSGLLSGNAPSFRFRHMIGLERKTVGLFFGSRGSEIENNADAILEAASKLKQHDPDIYFIVPTLPKWKELLEAKLIERGLNALVLIGKEEKWDAMAACDVAIAVSGTVALEIAAVGVPHVITYRVNSLTWHIAQRLIKTPHVHLANILLNERVVPEFIQHEATSENIYVSVQNLLNDSNARYRQIENFGKIRDLLQNPEKINPADKAAGFILNLNSL